MLLKSFSTERARVPVPRAAGRPVGGRPRLARGGDCCYYHSVLQAPLAQLAEQRTLNPRVRGSSPWRRTRDDLVFHHPRSFLRARFVPVAAPWLLARAGPAASGLRAGALPLGSGTPAHRQAGRATGAGNPPP